MFGALTAADPDEFIEEDIEATPTGFEVGVSEGVVADLTPAYDAAIKRLREQRGGLSAKERLGALLVGFGQPTRHGKWQESLGNASQMLFQQSLARRKEDEDRRTQLEKLMSAREVAKIRANATTEAARIRAEKAAAAGTTGVIKPRVQVGSNPLSGEAEGFYITPGPDGKPMISRLPIDGGATGEVAIPEISEPEQAAKHANSPVVKTPMGLMKNPFYKGG